MKIIFDKDKLSNKLNVGEVIHTENGLTGIVIEDYGMILNTSMSPVFRDTLPLNTNYKRVAKIQDFRIVFNNKNYNAPIEKFHKGSTLYCGDLVITAQGKQAIVIRPDKKFCELLYLNNSTKDLYHFATTNFLLKLASRDDYSLEL